MGGIDRGVDAVLPIFARPWPSGLAVPARSSRYAAPRLLIWKARNCPPPARLRFSNTFCPDSARFSNTVLGSLTRFSNTIYLDLARFSNFSENIPRWVPIDARDSCSLFPIRTTPARLWRVAGVGRAYACTCLGKAGCSSPLRPSNVRFYSPSASATSL